MTDDQFKKGIEQIKQIKLTLTEKERMLKRVFDTPQISPYAPTISFWGVFLHQSRVAYVFALLFLLVSFGSVLAYNAEKALPGDSLYFLKVGVTEPIRDLVNTSPEKKAEWESAKTVRRLDEALNLAAEGKLNEKNRSDLEARFSKHTEAFDNSVNAIASSTKKSTKSELIKIEFEAGVSAKTKAIDNLEQKLREENKEMENDDNGGKKQINNRNRKSNEEVELNKFKKTVYEKLRTGENKQNFVKTPKSDRKD